MAVAYKYVLVASDMDPEIFDSIEDATEFIKDQFDDSELHSVRIYKSSNAYEVSNSGLEIEEVDF